MKLTTLFALMLWPLWAMPQEIETTTKHEGSGSLHVGFANLSNSDFQQFLPDDFDHISDRYLLLGGEGYALKGNFLFGGSGQAIIGRDEHSGSQKTKIRGGMGFLNAGYALINQEKVKFFPMLGIGLGGLSFRIGEDTDISLKEIVDEPEREITLEVGNFMLDFSLGLDYIPNIQMAKNGKKGGGFKTGIRVGYMLGFNNNWAYGGGEVKGAPDFGINSFYVKLAIGGYGFSMEER